MNIMNFLYTSMNRIGFVTLFLFSFPLYFVYFLLIQLTFSFSLFIYSFVVLTFVNLSFLNFWLDFLDESIRLVKKVPTWEDGFTLKKENKRWIKTLYRGPRSIVASLAAIGKGSISNEMRRFCSIVAWMTSTTHMRPYYVTFLNRVERMICLNGLTHTFKYLKEVMRLLVRALSGNPELVRPIGSVAIRMKCDHYGLPQLLPLGLRVELRKYIDYMNNPDLQHITPTPHWEVAPVRVKPFDQNAIVGVLSIVTVFRVMKTIVSPTLKTIVAPFNGLISTLDASTISNALNSVNPRIIERHKFIDGKLIPQYKAGSGGKLKLSVGAFHPHSSTKAGPNGSLSTWAAGIDAIAFMHEPLKALKLLGWMMDQKAYAYILWFICLNLFFGLPYIIWYSISEVFAVAHAWLISSTISITESLLILFYGLEVGTYGSPHYNKIFVVSNFLTLILSPFASFFRFWRISVGKGSGARNKLYLGKLGVVYDQAGKARVVAASNWWIQSAFHGLHKSIFAALKLIPSDGTFNQKLAYDNFINKMNKTNNMSGFDLSAATDRLPIALQMDILIQCGVDGQTWRELLDFEWATPFKNEEGLSEAKYAVGQPMGAYSSWAMLALTHHVIVFAASEMAKIPFEEVNYAVLGDDVVIGNDPVAICYVGLMKQLGLEISMGKSVISKRFTEFAKRLQGPGVDFSPIGAGAILAALRSGYMFPALFKSAIGNVITSVQDVQDLIGKVPAGLVSRRDLSKFTSLVIWQIFGPMNIRPVDPSQFGAFALEWVSGLPDTNSLLVDHLLDSIGNINMRRIRKQIAEAHLPLSCLFTGLMTITISGSPFLRVLENLIKLFNPGFWLYFTEGLIMPIRMWEKVEKFYEELPEGVESGYMESLARLKYTALHTPALEITTLPLTKAETVIRARFYFDVLKDISFRYRLSEESILHRNWYELTEHYGRSPWPEF